MVYENLSLFCLIYLCLILYYAWFYAFVSAPFWVFTDCSYTRENLYHSACTAIPGPSTNILLFRVKWVAMALFQLLFTELGCKVATVLINRRCISILLLVITLCRLIRALSELKLMLGFWAASQRLRFWMNKLNTFVLNGKLRTDKSFYLILSWTEGKLIASTSSIH